MVMWASSATVTVKNNTKYFMLSKPQPQPNLNTTVGFDTKMTLQTPPHPSHPTTETFQSLLDDLES